MRLQGDLQARTEPRPGARHATTVLGDPARIVNAHPAVEELDFQFNGREHSRLLGNTLRADFAAVHDSNHPEAPVAPMSKMIRSHHPQRAAPGGRIAGMVYIREGSSASLPAQNGAPAF